MRISQIIAHKLRRLAGPHLHHALVPAADDLAQPNLERKNLLTGRLGRQEHLAVLQIASAVNGDMPARGIILLVPALMMLRVRPIVSIVSARNQMEPTRSKLR
jgi:hypothetical protein